MTHPQQRRLAGSSGSAAGPRRDSGAPGAARVLGWPFAWGGPGAAGGGHGPNEWCSVAGLKALEKSLATYLNAFASQ